MKKKYLPVFLVAVVLILALVAGCRGGEAGGPGVVDDGGGAQPPVEKTVLTSDKIVKFYYYYPSGNMPDNDFRIIKEDGGFVLEENTYEWFGGTDVSLNSKKYPIDEDALRELQGIVVEHDIVSWDGFDKQAEEITTLNTRFRIEITYDDGTVIAAQGDHAFPEGYKEAERALLAFCYKIIDIKEEEDRLQYEADELVKRKEILKDVSNLRTLNISRGNYHDENIFRYEITTKGDGFELAVTGFDSPLGIDPVPVSNEQVQEIISIYKKYDAYSWDGFDDEIEGSNDFVSMNDIYYDSQGRSCNFRVYGVGAEPDGFTALYDELVAYLDGLLGI